MKYNNEVKKLHIVGEKMEIIRSDESVYSIISRFPEIKEIMVEIGFKDIVKAGMLQSLGRIMTIKKGCIMKKLDIDMVKKAFLEKGFNLEVKEE